MNLKLTKDAPSSDTVRAISSKSYVHRLMIAASLYGGEASIITNILSSDMKATANVINALGGSVHIREEDGDRIRIDIGAPLGTKRLPETVLDCNESGSTARFILPVAPVFADTATLCGSGRLPDRPMGPLCDVLRKGGCDVSADKLPITISGIPAAGDYDIAGNVSSQFISGLLFALPLLEGESRLRIKGGLQSAAYADMTLEVLKRFGAPIGYEDGVYTTPGLAGYKGADIAKKRETAAEGDWSNAAYIMAMAAFASKVYSRRFYITGLDPDSIQPDRAVTGILAQMGIDISYDKKSKAYGIMGGPQDPVDTDCSQIPDLVPALCILAAYCRGKSIFRNVERLRMKECDRLEAVSAMLSAVSVKVDIISQDGSEDMVVYGKGMADPVKEDIVIDSFNDHRIAMAASALVFAEDGGVTLKDAMAVDKSYPGFYDVAAILGLSNRRA